MVPFSLPTGDHDFYRCRQCHRLLVGRAVQQKLAAGRDAAVCRCGSYQLQPCAAPWYALCLPRVWPLVLERLRVLGWHGLKENARADAVAWLLKGMPRHRFSSGVPSTAAEGPIVLAGSRNMATILGDYIEVYTGETPEECRPRPIAVGGLWTAPAPPVEAPRSPADDLLRDLGPAPTQAPMVYPPTERPQ